MKIGVLGLIMSDLSNVDYNLIRKAADLGFAGVGAHLTVPAHTISNQTAATVKSVIADQGIDFLQLWGPYPCIISPDERVRQAGVAQAQDIVRLAAKMNVPGSGVRPTSLSPRGDWVAHPANYAPETEERLVRSLKEIVATADDFGIDIILEAHQTSTLNSAQAIRRVIEQTESERVKVNLDPANFVTDLQTAFNPTPVIHELFDLLEPYIDTVHVKDVYVEDHFIVHISETVIGAGIMDLDTVLRRAYQAQPDGYVIIEHLPLSQIPLAKRNLDQKIKALRLPVG